MKCEYLGHGPDCSGEVSIRHAMTRYVFDGKKNSPEDPNRDFLACETHWGEYEDHWKEMWHQYYYHTL
jgi:hypothetical protein